MPGSSFAGSTSYRTWKASVMSQKFQPAFITLTFASAISGRLLNLTRSQSIVDSSGRLNSQ